MRDADPNDHYRSESVMLIWKLVPLDLDDPSWQGSSHRGPVVVRAPDEERARGEAQRIFGVPTRFPPGAAYSRAVWKRRELVNAEIVSSGRFDPAGPVAVLEPSFETDLARWPKPD
jgi:hypothetical protein